MKIPLYQLDAFSRVPFGGNPAAVCPLERWLPDETLQAIAAENNLAETAFFVRENGTYRLRWFTPVVEMPLCGHATLATGHVILNLLEPGRERVRFETLSGPVEVSRDGERLSMDFPALPLKRQLDPDLVAAAIGVRPQRSGRPIAGWRCSPILHKCGELRPDIGQIAGLPFKSLIVTARGFDGDCDFVSRFFAPQLGIPEDPVTGSAHCVLTPYWSSARKGVALRAPARRAAASCGSRSRRTRAPPATACSSSRVRSRFPKRFSAPRRGRAETTTFRHWYSKRGATKRRCVAAPYGKARRPLLFDHGLGRRLCRDRRPEGNSSFPATLRLPRATSWPRRDCIAWVSLRTSSQALHILS